MELNLIPNQNPVLDTQKLRQKKATVEKAENGYIITLTAEGSREVIMVEQWLKRALKIVSQFMLEV